MQTPTQGDPNQSSTKLRHVIKWPTQNYETTLKHVNLNVV